MEKNLRGVVVRKRELLRDTSTENRYILIDEFIKNKTINKFYDQLNDQNSKTEIEFFVKELYDEIAKRNAIKVHSSSGSNVIISVFIDTYLF